MAIVHSDFLASYLICLALGFAVGYSELVSRYKDAPFSLFQSLSAWIYILINGLASLAAMYLVLEMRWLDDIAGSGASAIQTQILQTLVAAFGAMAFFRSSLFTTRIGNSDVAIGPAGFLQIVLQAADRGTDRYRAERRAVAISQIMRNSNYDRAKEALPLLCFGLMQNASSESQNLITQIIKKLDEIPNPNNDALINDIKANSLGLELLNLVGEKVLREAVIVFRRIVSFPAKPMVTSVETLALLNKVPLELYTGEIIDHCFLLSSQTDSQIYRRRLNDTVKIIRKIRTDNVGKRLLLSSFIMNEFGEETLSTVLRTLSRAEAKVPQPWLKRFLGRFSA